MIRPPLGLAFTLEAASGRKFRIGSSEAEAKDRPIDFGFSTEAGEGFAGAQLSFRRDYAGDHPDLDPLNELVALGVDGQTAYEGRGSGPLRSLDSGGGMVRSDFEGWMSHARQTPFCALGLDADSSQWQEPDQARRAVILPVVSTLNTSVQVSSEGALNFHSESGTPVPQFAWGEMDYKSPAGAGARGMFYKGQAANGTGFDFPSVNAGGGAQTPILDNTLRSLDFSTARGLIAAIVRNNTGVTPAAGAPFTVTYPVATPYGDHGLTMVPRSDGRPAFQLTDLLIWIFNRWAPKIDTSKVVPNSYPVAHAVWRELTNAQEAGKDLNRYSQWAMGIYEGHALEFRPFDLSVPDWQVRAGQDGVEIETPGQTVNDAANGVVVTYTDFTGVEQMITPEEASDLIDNNAAIAANQWGDKAWIERPLSGMCTRDDAVQIGRNLLLDFNRPKFPSTIKVPGYIRNGRGQWEQAWKPRSNQTVRVMNHPNDLPRLITKTEWSGNNLSITTDNALNRMDAVLARRDNARLAGGIS